MIGRRSCIFGAAESIDGLPASAINPVLPAAAHLNRGITVLTVIATFTMSVAACAQSSGPVSEAAEPATLAPSTPPPVQAVADSGWDAPEPWLTDRFYLETSLYTTHFHYDPAHDDHQHLILVEWNITEHWLVGGSVFDNSFGQASQYIYGGYRFRPFDSLQPLYFKVSAGLVHGYSGQYQNKIPLNNSGVAPVIVPSVGYCINRFCSELVIFGTAGALVTLGVTIP
jgi:hypothetical protein